MPTISTADFKNGLGLRIKDKVYTIVEFQHVKPGKGGAFVRYKTRDIKSGPCRREHLQRRHQVRERHAHHP